MKQVPRYFEESWAKEARHSCENCVQSSVDPPQAKGWGIPGIAAGELENRGLGGVLEVDHLSWALKVGRICMGCQRREDYRANYLSHILQMASNKLDGWTDGWTDD